MWTRTLGAVCTGYIRKYQCKMSSSSMTGHSTRDVEKQVKFFFDVTNSRLPCFACTLLFSSSGLTVCAACAQHRPRVYGVWTVLRSSATVPTLHTSGTERNPSTVSVTSGGPGTDTTARTDEKKNHTHHAGLSCACLLSTASLTCSALQHTKCSLRRLIRQSRRLSVCLLHALSVSHFPSPPPDPPPPTGRVVTHLRP